MILIFQKAWIITLPEITSSRKPTQMTPTKSERLSYISEPLSPQFTLHAEHSFP